MAYYDFYGDFPKYVPVAERRAKALLQARKLEKRGRVLEPVRLEGQRIAGSFWGKEWCKNLESYMDFSNRLPRGRTYLRTGAVVDLRLGPGQIDALVAGGSLYEVSVRIDKLARKRWGALIKRCAGRIDSVVELLRGRLPERVLEALVDRRAGLFPAPKEIDFTCSCPDSALLCKHIAAVLYGVGARLDKKPELFFTLRSVALEELVAKSALRRAGPGQDALETRSLEGIFGIELDREPRRRRR
ncbi:MAG TPA: SWIM zinc finger family protein [Myxococcales bacterium]